MLPLQHSIRPTKPTKRCASAARSAGRPVSLIRLDPSTELFELVVYLLRQRFSPQQIAGKLRRMEFPKFEDVYVCRETIYNAIYPLPVGSCERS
jgi:IS30 family transposase